MADIETGIELWLTAERQQMARPDALTAFLSDRAAMLNTVGFEPDDSRNTGVAKARSHINSCLQLGNVFEAIPEGSIDWFKKLGDLASKSLKVASGYSMKAGYFYPADPDTLYRDRMISLVDESGNPAPVLGLDAGTLAQLGGETASVDSPVRSIADIKSMILQGQESARKSDNELRQLLLAERERDYSFAGSLEAQETADGLTLETKGLFVAISVGVLRLQQEGPSGLGAIILEPRSDAAANHYMRVEKLQPTDSAGVLSVFSVDMIER